MEEKIVRKPEEHKKKGVFKSLVKSSLYVVPVYVIAKAFKDYLEKESK